MKYIGLMPFEPTLVGEAREAVGTEKLPKFDGPLPKVEDGVLVGFPEPQPDTIWVCNAFVFDAAKAAGRTDIAMFDPEKTQRDEQGRAIAQGGFIYA